MVDHRPRLTLWGDGEYVLLSAGEDGSSTMLTVRPEGPLVGSTITPAGIREVMYLEADGGWSTRAVPDLATKLRYLRAELGAWVAGGPTKVRYQDGVEAKVTRSAETDWDQWEAAHSPAHKTAKGWTVGDNTTVTIWHPRERAPGGGSTQESVSLGTEIYKGHKSTSSSTTVTERDAAGHMTREISRTGGYDHTTGTKERDVSIRYGNGDWVKQIHRDEPDGSWTDTTTTKQGGHYVVRTATGHGDKTETYRETESDTDPTDDDDSEDGGEDTPESDPPEKDSPVGDGSDTGSEGNPDGPLAGVSIRDLIGDDWKGEEGLDTLGDLDGLMRPWLDRIRATLAEGAGGTVDPGELLDTLGAVPEIDIDLSGYEPDEFADHDSLGKPPPIFGTVVEVGAIEAGALEAGALDGSRISALTVAQLQSVAETFALSAATAAQSVALLRHR